MHPYQHDFIEFAIASEVLRFGHFVLKSGRESPYFFNSGGFDTGARLAKLGRFYAQSIVGSEIEFDFLFGPAYKGIPLVAATSMAFWELYQRDVPYSFNRKETKDHGEGGELVGAAVEGRGLIVDDVISAGTSVRESVLLLRAAGAVPVGVSIALDREERGIGGPSAVEEVAHAFGLAVCSIVGLGDLVEYLSGDVPNIEPEAAAQHLGAIRAYRERYGRA